MKSSGLLLLLLLLAIPAVLRAGALPISANVRITDAGLTDLGNAELPAITLVGDKAYAVWQDDRRALTDDSIYFAQSSDGGATWSANQRISTLPYDKVPGDAQIAVQPNGTIWILWHLLFAVDSERVNDLRMAKSTDGGATFAVTTLVNGFDNEGDLDKAQMTVDESTGKLYFVLDDLASDGQKSGFEIWLFSYNEVTNTWDELMINDAPVSGRDNPSSAIDGPRMSLTARNGTVCVAWEDERARFAIYGACSRDGGKTFGANFPISGADGLEPHIAIAPDGKLYATYYEDADARRNLQLRTSSDLGVTWSQPRNITNLTSEQVGDYDLEVDANGQVVVVWEEDSGPTGSGNLWLSTSIDGGLNFARVLVEDGQGEHPLAANHYDVNLALAGTGTSTRALMAWEDTRNSFGEIWSARATLDGVAPTAPTNLRAIAGDTSNLLTWQPASDDNGIAGYRIYWATMSGGPYTELAPLLVTGTTYRDVEVPAVPLFYKVAAVDGTGNLGPQSNEASATAQAGTDLPVSGVFAYEQGTQIRLRDFASPSNERILAEGRTPHFASNGQRIFYYNNGGIFSQGVAGGDQQTLWQDAALTDAYDLVGDQPKGAVVLQKPYAGLGVPTLCTALEPHFGPIEQLTTAHPFALAPEVAVSADGRWLAYQYIGFCSPGALGQSDPPDFCLVDLNNGNQRTCLDHANFHDPDFAPSGSILVFAAPYSGQHEIWQATVQNNGSLVNLIQLTRGPQGQPSRGPAWSLDGNWVIFQRDVAMGESEDWRLYVVRADGSALRALNVAGQQPVWHGTGSAAPPPDPSILNNKAYLPMVKK